MPGMSGKTRDESTTDGRLLRVETPDGVAIAQIEYGLSDDEQRAANALVNALAAETHAPIAATPRAAEYPTVHLPRDSDDLRAVKRGSTALIDTDAAELTTTPLDALTPMSLAESAIGIRRRDATDTDADGDGDSEDGDEDGLFRRVDDAPAPETLPTSVYAVRCTVSDDGCDEWVRIGSSCPACGSDPDPAHLETLTDALPMPTESIETVDNTEDSVEAVEQEFSAGFGPVDEMDAEVSGTPGVPPSSIADLAEKLEAIAAATKRSMYSEAPVGRPESRVSSESDDVGFPARPEPVPAHEFLDRCDSYSADTDYPAAAAFTSSLKPEVSLSASFTGDDAAWLLSTIRGGESPRATISGCIVEVDGHLDDDSGTVIVTSVETTYRP